MWRYIYIILANSCAKSASLAPRGQVLTSHLLQALQGSHPGLARYLWFSPKISMKNCREPERMAFNNVLSSSTVEILDDLLVAQFWGTSIYNYPPWTSMRWCDYSGSPKIIEKSNACGKGFPMQKMQSWGSVQVLSWDALSQISPKSMESTNLLSVFYIWSHWSMYVNVEQCALQDCNAKIYI